MQQTWEAVAAMAAEAAAEAEAAEAALRAAEVAEAALRAAEVAEAALLEAEVAEVAAAGPLMTLPFTLWAVLKSMMTFPWCTSSAAAILPLPERALPR